MVILKYELKRHRKYILGWAIALALCVFVMTPTYYSFMDVSTGDLMKRWVRVIFTKALVCPWNI